MVDLTETEGEDFGDTTWWYFDGTEYHFQCMDKTCPTCRSDQTHGAGTKTIRVHDIDDEWRIIRVSKRTCLECGDVFDEKLDMLMKGDPDYAPRMTKRLYRQIVSMIGFHHYSNADIFRQTGVDEKIIRTIRKRHEETLPEGKSGQRNNLKTLYVRRHVKVGRPSG